MSVWTTLVFPEDSRLPSLKLQQLQDNVTAWVNQASGSPTIVTSAVVDSSVTVDKLDVNTAFVADCRSMRYHVQSRHFCPVNSIQNYAFFPHFHVTSWSTISPFGTGVLIIHETLDQATYPTSYARISMQADSLDPANAGVRAQVLAVDSEFYS